MVRLYTDHPQYLNDLADEIRLFAGKEEIAQAPEDACDASVTLGKTGALWIACAKVRNASGSGAYTFEIPAVTGDLLEIKRNEKRAMKIALFRALHEATGFLPPWGSLTGIRPTRLLRELIESVGEEQALHMMRESFDVSQGRLELAHEICRVQRPILKSQTPQDVDVYINIPFCTTKCLYCSFPSQVRTEKTDMGVYLDALTLDIASGARILSESGRKVRAMYMGGGTPSVLTAGELERVLAALRSAYGEFTFEFTLEAGRPDTITKEKLNVMRAFNVSRISVNPQSMNAKTLALIGRAHSPEAVVDAFAMAREAGFTNINADVIAGLPGEDESDFARTLERIAALSPESLTVHTLALKRTSRLVTDAQTYPMPDAATAAGMVRAGESAARAMGMRPYYMYRQKYMSGNLENVGYSKPGCDCVYNVDMMEDTTAIMAHGAGGMTKCVYDAQRRVERVPAPKDIETYAAKAETLTAQKRKLFIQ